MGIIKDLFGLLKNVKRQKKMIESLEKSNFTLQESLIESLDKPLFHVSAFALTNAGDNILVSALRKSVNDIFTDKFNYISRHVYKEVTDEEIFLMNKTKGIIIGGGGLFLRDTNRNDISGWQFPISTEQIKQIKVPVSILGVGYNRFRGQKDFKPYFKENINTLVEKACFVGLRNNGSIRALKKYLNEDLHNKLSFHPCATTVLSKLYDIKPRKNSEIKIAFNIAFDRENKRFGKNASQILKSIAKVAQELSKIGRIQYFVHCEPDCKILKYFDNLNIDYEVIRLNKALSEKDIIEAYTEPSLVIGMRGHAQMIPFGCGTPILSIISHDKLAWFLEDINHPEWGVEIFDKEFEEKLLEKSKFILNNNITIKKQIDEAQEKLYKIICSNLKEISKYYL